MAKETNVQVIVEVAQGFVVLAMRAGGDSLAMHVVLTVDEAGMLVDLLRSGIDRLNSTTKPSTPN